MPLAGALTQEAGLLILLLIRRENPVGVGRHRWMEGGGGSAGRQEAQLSRSRNSAATEEGEKKRENERKQRASIVGTADPISCTAPSTFPPRLEQIATRLEATRGGETPFALVRFTQLANLAPNAALYGARVTTLRSTTTASFPFFPFVFLPSVGRLHSPLHRQTRQARVSKL